MENIDYTTAIIWYALWPVVIFLAYKFIRINVEHLEKNLENRFEDDDKN